MGKPRTSDLIRNPRSVELETPGHSLGNQGKDLKTRAIQDGDISVVSVVVQDSQGRVMLLRRSDGHKTGVWENPGGHREEGETIEEAGIREVKEETGLDVKILPGRVFFTMDKDKKHVGVMLRGIVSGGEVVLKKDEHDLGYWVERNKLGLLEKVPTHKDFQESVKRVLGASKMTKKASETRDEDRSLIRSKEQAYEYSTPAKQSKAIQDVFSQDPSPGWEALWHLSLQRKPSYDEFSVDRAVDDEGKYKGTLDDPEIDGGLDKGILPNVYKVVASLNMTDTIALTRQGRNRVVASAENHYDLQSFTKRARKAGFKVVGQSNCRAVVSKDILPGGLGDKCPDVKKKQAGDNAWSKCEEHVGKDDQEQYRACVQDERKSRSAADPTFTVTMDPASAMQKELQPLGVSTQVKPGAGGKVEIETQDPQKVVQQIAPPAPGSMKSVQNQQALTSKSPSGNPYYASGYRDVVADELVSEYLTRVAKAPRVELSPEEIDQKYKDSFRNLESFILDYALLGVNQGLSLQQAFESLWAHFLHDQRNPSQNPDFGGMGKKEIYDRFLKTWKKVGGTVAPPFRGTAVGPRGSKEAAGEGAQVQNYLVPPDETPDSADVMLSQLNALMAVRDREEHLGDPADESSIRHKFVKDRIVSPQDWGVPLDEELALQIIALGGRSVPSSGGDAETRQKLMQMSSEERVDWAKAYDAEYKRDRADAASRAKPKYLNQGNRLSPEVQEAAVKLQRVLERHRGGSVPPELKAAYEKIMGALQRRVSSIQASPAAPVEAPPKPATKPKPAPAPQPTKEPDPFNPPRPAETPEPTNQKKKFHLSKRFYD